MEGKELHIGGRFEEFVPVELVERREGAIVLSVAFDERHLNAAGMVHGGFIMSALDVALAGAAVAAPGEPRRLYGITLSMTVNFIAPLPAIRVTCHGRVTGGGARTRFVDGELRGPAGEPPGTLYATATGTIRVVDLDA